MAEETHKIDGYAGQPITLPTLESLGWKKDNYIFIGWALSPDATTCIAGDGTEHIFYENANLYAVWQPTDYLCFTATEVEGAKIQLWGNGLLNGKHEYSLDNKRTWTTWEDEQAGVVLPTRGSSMYIRAKEKISGLYPQSFKPSNKVYVSGNVMSLIDPDLTRTDIPAYDGFGCFQSLFYETSEASQYFQSVPTLPAKILSKACYVSMFHHNSSITTAPSLPATKLVEACYQSMFQYCSSLESAKIDGIDLEKDCCRRMFSDCSSLKTLEVNFTDLPQESFYNWLDCVPNTSDCTFICPQELKDKLDNGEIERSESTVPSNWTIVAKQ